MMTVVVVVIDESKDSLIKRRAVFLGLDVNVVIFYRSPKSFNPDNILCPAAAVHANPHFRMFCARFLPIQAGKLTSLIRVNNFRYSILRDGVFEHLNAVRRIQCVMQTPAHDKTTVNVDDGRQVHESFRHRDIRNVYTPYLIPMVYLLSPPQIRHDVNSRSGNTQVLLRIDGLDAHQTHQATDSALSNLVTLIQKEVCHLYNAFLGMSDMFLVHLAHHLKVLFTFALGRVIVSRAAYVKDLALFADAQLLIRGYQSSAGISIPNYLDTRFAKSSRISKSPILRRYRSFCFSSASSSCRGDSNAAAEFSMNSFFYRLIITGDTSYLAASSLSVSRSFKASMATFALNLASYFFLLFFMVLSYYFLT